MAPEDKDGNTVAAEETPEKSKVDVPPKENTPPKEKRQLKRKAKEEKGSDAIMEEVLSISGNSESTPKSKKHASESSSSGLPDGWKRSTVTRKSGKTAGQVDVYFFTPDGGKLRSKPEVKSYLAKKKLNIKLEAFDFSKRIENGEKAKKPAAAAATSKKPKAKKAKNTDLASGEGTSQDDDDERNGDESTEEETVKKSPQKKTKKAPSKPMKKEVVQIKALKKKRTKK